MEEKDNEQDKKGGFCFVERPIVIKAGNVNIKITPSMSIIGEDYSQEEPPFDPKNPVVVPMKNGQILMGFKIDIGVYDPPSTGITSPVDGQVFIGNAVDIAGTVE